MSSCTTILVRKPNSTAIQTDPAHNLNVVEGQIPTPGPLECLIHVRATGICGSDVHFWKHGAIGSSSVTAPLTLGHESAGIVIETGAEVKDFTIGIERSGLRLGDPLVILGAGPIGIVSLLAAHAAGAVPIAITDLDPNRLAVAKSLVPRVHPVLVSKDDEPKQVGREIVESLGQQASLALECTGVQSSVHAAIYATKFGGTVYIIGSGRDFQEIPFMYASFREIDIRFQFRYHETYPKAIRLVSEGLINLKPLVTHRFGLEQGKEAFEAASDSSARAIKVQILDD
ncbi:MAG: hypothetical protein Q9157_005940 [Trypethelium eluteriae]